MRPGCHRCRSMRSKPSRCRFKVSSRDELDFSRMDFPMDFRMDFPHVPKDHCDIIVTLRFARSSKDWNAFGIFQRSLAPFRSLSDSVWSQVKLSTLMCCFPGKGQRHQSSRSSRWVTQTHERHETLGASMFLGVFLYPSIFLLSSTTVIQEILRFASI